MTTFRLLRALTRTMLKCEWYLDCTGGIRSMDKDVMVCPLTFVEKVATGRRIARSIFEAEEAGQVLGFSKQLADDIAFVADFHPIKTWSRIQLLRLRRILLKAARLE